MKHLKAEKLLPFNTTLIDLPVFMQERCIMFMSASNSKPHTHRYRRIKRRLKPSLRIQNYSFMNNMWWKITWTYHVWADLHVPSEDLRRLEVLCLMVWHTRLSSINCSSGKIYGKFCSFSIQPTQQTQCAFRFLSFLFSYYWQGWTCLGRSYVILRHGLQGIMGCNS